MRTPSFHRNQETQKILNDIATKESAYWERIRRAQALKLFKEAAQRVPAYADFLKRNHVDPATIQTWKNFETVPITDKNNYLRQYPLEKLVWDGTLKKPMVFSETSGSTGSSFYFPRDQTLDWQQSVLNELFLKNTVRAHNDPTLVIITFGMGVWIGGLINYQAFELVSNRSIPLSIITPGVNKEEVIKALRDLAPRYAQTIIVGYPPFVKDIIDEACRQKIPIKKFNLRFLFAAEAFTETFRNYITHKAGIKNPFLDTLNIYGTADIGPMAFETPISILARRLIRKKKKTANMFFSRTNSSPTFAQYNPHFITFESPQNTILVTGNSVLPLIRYAVGDRGETYSFETVRDWCRKNGIDLHTDARRKKVPLYHLPFVAVYERTDFSVKLYGAIMYPEHIREALLHPSLKNVITGKFVAQIKNDRKRNQYLEIAIELQPGVTAGGKLIRQTREHIVQYLVRKNTEYRNNYAHMPEKVTPRISFLSYENAKSFKPGAKQTWVRK